MYFNVFLPFFLKIFLMAVITQQSSPVWNCVFLSNLALYFFFLQRCGSINIFKKMSVSRLVENKFVLTMISLNLTRFFNDATAKHAKLFRVTQQFFKNGCQIERLKAWQILSANNETSDSIKKKKTIRLFKEKGRKKTSAVV